MAIPPQPLPPGEGAGRRETVPAWEYPGLDPNVLRFVKREGEVETNWKRLSLDKDGYVYVGPVRYLVLQGITSPEVNLRLPLGLNALFDRSCSVMGDVKAAGRLQFAGPVELKNVTASSIKFSYGITSWGTVYARDGNLEGVGSITAKDVKARGNVGVLGDVNGQLVMSLDGFLSANSITGEALLGRMGVYAMNGDLGYGSDKNPAERSICIIWSNEGRIHATRNITTGKICAAQNIQTTDGDLTIEGDAFCLGARIKGRVIDGSGMSAEERVYSRYVWECFDKGNMMKRMPPREVQPEDMERKLERSPFAHDRWEKYFADYSRD